MRIIVSNYRGHYESIHTEESVCMLFIKIKYLFKGYTVWSFPSIWMAKQIHRFTGLRTYKGTNISFEKFVPGSDQVTYWQPWMNFI